MKRIILSCIAIILLLPVPALAKMPPAKGDIFPSISLPVPEESRHVAYLGLGDVKGVFGLEHVDAKLIIIEMFSIYCPYCQKEAHNVNALYELIQSKGLGDDIKIFAIGPGNSAFEVGTFVDRYNVQFPMFPDKDYTFHKILGQTGTPYFFVIDMTQGERKVVYSERGALGDVATFLAPFEKMLEECK